MIGIYKITSPTGKVYIGQSLDINRRWRDYKIRLGKNQTALNLSFIKHGVNNHKFEIITVCVDDRNLLNKLEIFWIDYYKCLDSNFGLNCREGGSSGRLTEEAKNKISKSRMGMFTGKDNPFYNKVHSKETIDKIIESNKRRGDGRHYNNSRSKPILQFSLDGVFIKEYPSVSEIQRQIRFSKANISKACKGIYKQCNGYIWKFK